MKRPRGPLKSGIFKLFADISSFGLFPPIELSYSVDIYISRYINVPSREETETGLACVGRLPQVKNALECSRTRTYTEIFTHMCIKLHRNRLTICLECAWLSVLRTHPKIAGVKGRKGERFCTHSNMPTRSLSPSISPTCNTWHSARSYPLSSPVSQSQASV